MKQPNLKLSPVLCAMLLGIANLHAADRWWTTGSCAVGGAGTWSGGTAAQWSTASTGGGCVSWVNGDSMHFGGGAASGSYAVQLGTANTTFTVNRIVIVSGGATRVDIANVAFPTIVFSGTDCGVDVPAGEYFTLQSKCSGGPLKKTGAGRLDSPNTGNGCKFIIEGGYVSMSGANRIVATGSDAITFDGGGLGIGWASTYGTKTVASNRGITVNAGGAFFGASGAANDIIIQSPIIDGSGGTGSGGLTVTTGSPMASPYASGGVVNLQNTTGTANSYKGPTRVSSSCKIILGANNQIPDDSVLTLASGGTIDLAGYSDTVKSLASSGGGTLALGGGTVTLANPDGESAGSAVISGTGGKVVMTAGTWNTPSGSCTYSGGFTLNGGTLYLRGNTALGTGKFTINNGATRVAVASGSAARTISVPVDLAGDIIFGESGRNSITFQTGAFTLVGGDRQITADTVDTTINSAIGEDVAGRGLIKAGSGKLTLGNTANTFSGGVTLNAGTLSFAALQGLGTGSAIDFGGGILQYASGNTADISGRTVTINAGGATIDTGVNEVTFANAIGNSGAGGLTKAGTGKLTLSGANSYGGVTAVNQGTLLVEGSIGSGGVTVAAAATLGGGGTIGGAVTLNGTVTPGNSAGKLTTGNQTWNGGGKYVWEMDDANGTAGASPGWDLVDTGGGAVDVAADGSSKFTVELVSVPGGAANFDADTTKSWQIAAATTVNNFDAGDFTVVDTGFTNDLKGGAFAVESDASGINVKFVPNQSPVANDAPFTAAKGIPLRIKVADLLSGYTSDADSDGRALVSVGTPASGAASINGDYIYYTPGAAASDSFSYTVRDTRAYRAGDTVRTASANINVTVQDNGGTAQNIAFENGTLTVTFQAVPGLHYDVERAQDPGGPWSALAGYANITPNSGGKITVTDTQPDGWSQAYYRLKWLGN